MTDSTCVTMLEMAEALRAIEWYQAANMVEQAASQAAEIERLNRSHQGRVVIAHDGCRAQIETWIARAEAAESRLLALREQVEGLPSPGLFGGLGVSRADVLALFDPAQEKG